LLFQVSPNLQESGATHGIFLSGISDSPTEQGERITLWFLMDLQKTERFADTVGNHSWSVVALHFSMHSAITSIGFISGIPRSSTRANGQPAPNGCSSALLLRVRPIRVLRARPDNSEVNVTALAAALAFQVTL
jgi:hypothetical protein